MNSKTTWVVLASLIFLTACKDEKSKSNAIEAAPSQVQVAKLEKKAGTLLIPGGILHMGGVTTNRPTKTNSQSTR
ncbi:MAG: hypothetical protein K9J37_12780 [Saprospiraceae bacterium]|nr:hypothetical protein [Saprospiraceae bacterium]MCF8250783.1 hypothetical protein [Saprospiraceae bacterium]MCF8281761.1 hypothetical protein [Bacteroidales bacterium]MCF8312584.1 hypothetical protein [Saprospiraceae bacterium]MCF8440913.1 hypothetical protein [Saprospiraceae bacterium]